MGNFLCFWGISLVRFSIILIMMPFWLSGLVQASVQLYYLAWPTLDFEIYTPFSIHDQENKGSNSSVWLPTQNPDSITASHFRILDSLNLWLLNILISGQLIDISKILTIFFSIFRYFRGKNFTMVSSLAHFYKKKINM